jgi:CubicO group peptidase (beta-lactamase class C family)
VFLLGRNVRIISLVYKQLAPCIKFTRTFDFRILSRKTIETMMGYQMVELDPNEGKYHGLGFAVSTEKTMAKGGIGSPGTFEWGGAFNTQYFADPKEKIIGILMKQTLGSSESTGWKFRQMFYPLFDD